MNKTTCLKKIYYLPQDHGSWALLFSPLLIGLFSAPHFNRVSITIIAGAVLAFLLRQPVTIYVKTLSGRRPVSERRGALCWLLIYGLGIALVVLDLIRMGYAIMLWMAIPAGLVFIWHLYLVSRRAERRRPGVEIIGTGMLSLAAAAAYWAGNQAYTPRIWLLWLLVWLQAAASIVYAYMRLDQRTAKTMPSRPEALKMGERALLYTTFNLLFSLTLGVAGKIPLGLALAFSVQWLETWWGIWHPATGRKPAYIGIRQTVITTLFTLLFIIFWR